MRLIDLLLLAAIVLLSAAGWMVASPLGLATAGAGCAAAWFLLDDDGDA